MVEKGILSFEYHRTSFQKSVSYQKLGFLIHKITKFYIIIPLGELSNQLDRSFKTVNRYEENNKTFTSEGRYGCYWEAIERWS